MMNNLKRLKLIKVPDNDKCHWFVGNDLVHAGSDGRPEAVDRGMPSQGVSTE